MHNIDFNVTDVFVFSTFTEMPIVAATFTASFLNCQLTLVFVMHLLWTYMILKAVYKYMVMGQVG
jgi:hypothetical protein